MNARLHQWLLAAACALAVAVPAAARPATHTITITIEGMKFMPATVTVRRGDTVVWRNKDVVPHTATAKGVFDSGAIAPGRSWSQVMKKAGRSGYVCSFHPGMQGVVVVQ